MTPTPLGMATAAMAGAAGAAVVLYYTGWGNPWAVFGSRLTEDSSAEGREGESLLSDQSANQRRVEMPIRTSRAPSTWFEALAMISETLRFTYSETLGKWPIGDLAFGINYLLRKQAQMNVAAVYAGDENEQLGGPGLLMEMKELLRLLTVCMHFSKKTYPKFLEATGFTRDQVILEEGRAGLLKPAFTVLVDHDSCSILLLIRGTHSVKDTLTAVTGAVVPFHHTILGDAGITNLVLGYAHCGMVAAARWIAQLSTGHLMKALLEHPTYRIKVVGHSLGGGTAALLTYILRERPTFSSAHCVCFAPAACMTWELAESGAPFVTTVINGSDLVPCFCSASLDDLRAEVTASAWVNDFREQIERTRILRTVYRSASALSSHLQSIASLSRATLPYSTLMVARAAQTGAAGAGMIWRPVSSGTQVVMRQAQTVAQAVVRRPAFGAWSCMGPRRRNVAGRTSTEMTVEGDASSSLDVCMGKEKVDRCISGDESAVNSESLTTSGMTCDPNGKEHKLAGEYWETFMQSRLADGCNELAEAIPTVMFEEDQADDRYKGLHSDDDTEIETERIGTSSASEELGEDFLWQQLAQELHRQRSEVEDQSASEEEAAAAREITKEEEHVASSAASTLGQNQIVSEKEEPMHDLRRFFPPGKLMHLVSPLPNNRDPEREGEEERQNPTVGLFLTNRALYGKVRLSRTMVHDHYMPNYKHMLTSFIEQLERESLDSTSDVSLSEQVDGQARLLL